MPSEKLRAILDSLAYIERHQHALVRDQLGKIREICAAAPELEKAAPEQAPPAARQLAFKLLDRELEHHLALEEQVVFPLIRSLKTVRPPVGNPDAVPLELHLRQLIHEHEYLLELLTDFHRREGASRSASAELAEIWRQLEADLNQHFQYEQSFLFPKVMELESGRRAAGAGNSSAPTGKNKTDEEV